MGLSKPIRGEEPVFHPAWKRESVAYISIESDAKPILNLKCTTIVGERGDDPYPADNDRDYLMFYAHQENGNLPDIACIESPDMNFYFFGTVDVIYNIIPNIYQSLEGKTFVDLSEIEGTNEYDGNWKEYYIHKIKDICYATRWVIEE